MPIPLQSRCALINLRGPITTEVDPPPQAGTLNLLSLPGRALTSLQGPTSTEVVLSPQARAPARGPGGRLDSGPSRRCCLLRLRGCRAPVGVTPCGGKASAGGFNSRVCCHARFGCAAGLRAASRPRPGPRAVGCTAAVRGGVRPDPDRWVRLPRSHHLPRHGRGWWLPLTEVCGPRPVRVTPRSAYGRTPRSVQVPAARILHGPGRGAAGAGPVSS